MPVTGSRKRNFGGRLNSNELLLKIRKIAIRVLISSFEYYILYHIVTNRFAHIWQKLMDGTH